MKQSKPHHSPLIPFHRKIVQFNIAYRQNSSHLARSPHTKKWDCVRKLEVRSNIVKKPFKMLSSNMEADVGWCWQRGYVSGFLRD